MPSRKREAGPCARLRGGVRTPHTSAGREGEPGRCLGGGTSAGGTGGYVWSRLPPTGATIYHEVGGAIIWAATSQRTSPLQLPTWRAWGRSLILPVRLRSTPSLAGQ